MNPNTLNYHHLHYFWVVAKEGGVSRAAERLGVAAQTVSSQLAQLERSLGHALFAPQGRGLTLTEAGRRALGFADQIFLLGEKMVDALAEQSQENMQRLSVGISDGLAKLIAWRLLAPALPLPTRLSCFEGKFEALLADLALHKLDVVLTDRPAPSNSSLRVFSHALGESSVEFFATADLAARFGPDFPASLHGAPVLLPTRNNAIRTRLDQWFEAQGLRPTLVSEFEDSALLMTFGGTGLGLFPAASAIREQIQRQFGAQALGPIPGVSEQFFAISTERRISHPALESIYAARLEAEEQE